MKSLEIEDIKGIMVRTSELMVENRDELIRLDGLVGDGDLGLTMSKGFQAVVSEIETWSVSDVGSLCLKIGATMSRAAPSTMGTLVASGYMAGAKAVIGATSLNTEKFSKFLTAFVEGIMSRGKSKPGEKTLIDVLYPAAKEFAKCASSGADFLECISRCNEAGVAGFEMSKTLIAQHGRAAYYREKSKGQTDPGAAAAVLIVRAIYDYCTALS